MLKSTHIDADNIPDAWFQALSLLKAENSIGFDFLSIFIKHPYGEPWDSMLPKIPEHLDIPNPVQSGYIEDYIAYIMTDNILKKEKDIYGARIVPQITAAIEALSANKQAVIQIAETTDMFSITQPCLRAVSTKIHKGQVVFYSYWKNSDLWVNFPANMAGLAVLQKYIASELRIPIVWHMHFSIGTHVTNYQEHFQKFTGKTL